MSATAVRSVATARCETLAAAAAGAGKSRKSALRLLSTPAGTLACCQAAGLCSFSRLSRLAQKNTEKGLCWRTQAPEIKAVIAMANKGAQLCGLAETCTEKDGKHATGTGGRGQRPGTRPGQVPEKTGKRLEKPGRRRDEPPGPGKAAEKGIGWRQLRERGCAPAGLAPSLSPSLLPLPFLPGFRP